MGEAVGKATEAARLAGYAGSRSVLRGVGHENLTKPDILKAIEERQAADPLALSRQDLLRLWSEWAQSSEWPERQRLKASELLGRAFAMFKQTVQVVDLRELDDEQIEALAAGEEPGNVVAFPT